MTMTVDKSTEAEAARGRKRGLRRGGGRDDTLGPDWGL